MPSVHAQWGRCSNGLEGIQRESSELKYSMIGQSAIKFQSCYPRDTDCKQTVNRLDIPVGPDTESAQQNGGCVSILAYLLV
jgi:hypothetical protein